MLLVVEFVVYNAALGLAYALDNDLLGGLGGDAAELLRLDRDAQLVAGSGLLGVFLRALDVYLKRGVLHLLDDGHVDDEVYALLFLVAYHLDVLAEVRIVLAEGRQEGLLYLFVHVVAGNALFLLYVLHRGKEFCVHFSYLRYIVMRSLTWATCAAGKLMLLPFTSSVTVPSSVRPSSAPTWLFAPSTG